MATRTFYCCCFVATLIAWHAPSPTASSDHSPRQPSNAFTLGTTSSEGHEDFATTTVEPVPAPRCPLACMRNKDIERERIQSLKEYMLEKLGLPEPPKIPPHLKNNQFAINVLLDRANPSHIFETSAAPLYHELLRRRQHDEDDIVQPQKVIAFAETGTNNSQQCTLYEGKVIHFFRFSKEVMSYKVASARLWLYLQAPGYPNATRASLNEDEMSVAEGGQKFRARPPHGAAGPRNRLRHFAHGPPGSATSHHRGASHHRESTRTVVLTVVWARHLANGNGRLFASFLTSLKVAVPAKRGKWVHVDLTNTIAELFRQSNSQLGLVLSATDINGKEVVFSDDEDDTRTPFIEMTPSAAVNRTRSRRSLGINCDGKREEERCCRYPLTIDFRYLEWDWIIAPETYEANYCAGDCLYAFLPKYTHSYLLQIKNRTLCCAPRQMSPISMVYFNMEHHIVFSTLPGMTVEKCGCS